MSFYFDTKVELLEEIGGEENLEKYKRMNPSKLKLSLWVWLHPSAYKLIHWGIPFCAFFQFIMFYAIYSLWNWGFCKWIAIFFFVSGLITLYRQHNLWKARKGCTLYEIHLQNL